MSGVKSISSLVLFFILINTSLIANPEAWFILIDTTNTLVRVDEDAFKQDISGFTAGLKYALSHASFNPQDAIRRDFNALLESFGTQAGQPDHLIVRGQDGKPLPQILVSWLTGNISVRKLIKRIHEYADYEIFNKIAHAVFNARTIAKHTHPTRGAAQAVHKLIQYCGAHRIGIVGNWEYEAFKQITKAPETKNIFMHIPLENFYISGDTKLIMPRDAQALFNRISQTYSVPLNHIIFVTGMPNHARMAHSLGVVTLYLGDISLESIPDHIRTFISQ